MKLMRHGEPGQEEPGVILPDGRRVDASGEFHDYDEGFFASGGLEALAAWVEDGCPGGHEVSTETRLGPPIARPSKIICVGKNYADHAREFDGEVPSEPALFMKASSAWSGPHDDVVIPPGASKLDYEVELAVVISQAASHISESDAFEHIAGYSVFCDYSERAFQKEMGGQWTKGKSADTFAPMGPWLALRGDISDPQALGLWCKVNGELRQNGSSGDMVWPIAKLVAYISRFMTLLPGDVIATGTPGGVGMGMQPPQYLRPGDHVECGIEGIGQLSQRIVAHHTA